MVNFQLSKYHMPSWQLFLRTIKFTLGDIFIRDIIVVRDIYGVRNLGIFSNVNGTLQKLKWGGNKAISSSIVSHKYVF